MKLTPGRHLTVALVAQVGGTVAGTSDMKEVSTIDLEDRRILKAKVNRSAERVATSVTLSILPSETVTKHLVVAYGCQDCGKDRDAWDHVELLDTLSPSLTEYEWIVPTEAAKARAVRFFLLDDDDVFPVIQLYEGVQGDGTAWVDTGRAGTLGDGFEITFRPKADIKDGKASARLLMGSRQEAKKNNASVLLSSYTRLDYASSDKRAEFGPLSGGKWYRATLSPTLRWLYCITDGEAFDKKTSTIDTDFTTPTTMRLFTVYAPAGQVDDYHGNFDGAIREYIVTTGGGTVTNQHFVAAMLSDGTKVGFYDIADPDPATAWHENAAESGSLSVYGDQIGTIGEQELNLTDNSISCSLFDPGLMLILR